MNAEFGDFDNDEYLDIYVTNITEPWLQECNMLWRNAWAAGQKKKTRMTAICGAISTQGSQEDLKRTRFSMKNQAVAHVGRSRLAIKVIAFSSGARARTRARAPAGL